MVSPSRNRFEPSIKNLDHLGLVAGMCRELGIAEHLDAAVPEKTQKHHISHGQALVAMIINGLGFTSRALHLVPTFFKDKPTERLIGPGVLPEHLNDDALGRCLDALFATGVSEIYQNLAEQVISRLGLKGDCVHLDTTSIHVDGKYSYDETDEGTQRIQLVKGYSRDHRPDLNQVILQLISESQAGIPVYMQALSGNTNDQDSFHNLVSSHLDSLKAAQRCQYVIADSALFVAKTIRSLDEQNRLFISRAPMKIAAVKALVQAYQVQELTTMKNGYRGIWHDQEYAGVKQKWLLLFSEPAFLRESRTLNKNRLKSTEESIKRFNKLCQQSFACAKDAEKALAAFEAQEKYTLIHNPIVQEQPVYAGRGRPQRGQPPSRIDYYLSGQISTDLSAVEKARDELGFFVLATNDCSGELDMESMLAHYKSQQSVERGFRFLKSPDFMVSSLFLKKPERIEALLMVMTCSLMIYAALEHRIRMGLQANDDDFPDMKNKPSQRPTVRWVFQCFSGIHQIIVSELPPLVTGVTEKLWVIIDCLGEQYREIYS